MTSLYTLGLIGVSTLAIALLFEYVLRRLKRVISVNGEAHIANQIINLFRLVLYCIIILIDLGLVGIDIWGILASAGILGIVIGLAAQQSLANFFAGTYIIISHFVRRGEKLKINSIGSNIYTIGVVSKLGFSHVEMIGEDGGTKYIPNTLMINCILEKIDNSKENIDKR
jgi:small-conductance mechanosensitive channel